STIACQLPVTASASRPSTTPASSSVTNCAQAAGPYVQPVPTTPSQCAVTSTNVVESHALVPSASGLEVGIAYGVARSSVTTPADISAAARVVTVWQELLRLGADALLEGLPGVRIALHQGLRGVDRLVGGGVRRDGREVGVAVHIKHRRPVTVQREVPRLTELLG